MSSHFSILATPLSPKMKTPFNLLIFTVLFYFSSFNNKVLSQTILLGPQSFDNDVLVHGSTAPTTVWFAPDYNTPIDYNATGGCTGGYAGYSGAWNSYWGNFIRTPEVNCTGTDTVVMSFDLSNSFISGHTNDKVYFNMWADGAYHDASTNQTVFFDEVRNCVHFEVVFDVSSYVNKNILFYFNASCGYNDAQPFYVKFDNIMVYSYMTTSLQENINDPVQLYPNPATHHIAIESEAPSVIEITNIGGQTVYVLKNLQNKALIDVSGLPAGLYFVAIRSAKEHTIRKLLKK